MEWPWSLIEKWSSLPALVHEHPSLAQPGLIRWQVNVYLMDSFWVWTNLLLKPNCTLINLQWTFICFLFSVNYIIMMSHQESDLSRLIQLCSKGKIIKPKSWAGIYINQWELQWISRLEKGVFVLNWICSLGTFCQEGFCGDSINTNCNCCSVAKWCLVFCDPMDCSTPGFPVLSPAPEVCSDSWALSWWCHQTISSSVTPCSSCPQSFLASGSFPVSQLFPSGGQSIGDSASASVLPMNIQGWFILGLTG